MEPKQAILYSIQLHECSAQCVDDRLAVQCAIEVGRMRVSWSLETWNRVPGTARNGAALCCGSGLVLLVCTCVYAGVLGLMCMFAPFSLLVPGLALIFSRLISSGTDHRPVQDKNALKELEVQLCCRPCLFISNCLLEVILILRDYCRSNSGAELASSNPISHIANCHSRNYPTTVPHVNSQVHKKRPDHR